MTTVIARRYAPSQTAKLEPQILALLGDWNSAAAICEVLGRSSYDGAVGYALKRMKRTGVIERKTAPGWRGGMTYLYRRKA